MIQLINELSGIVIAMLAGLYSFRYIHSFYKVYFIQLLIYILVYILSYVVLSLPNINPFPGSNQWLYNLQIPIETGLLVWAGYQYFKPYKERFLLLIGYVIVFAVFICEVIIKGLNVFANHGYIAESILLLILYLVVLYSQFRIENNSWKRSPDIWIALGIIIYFGGIVPYLSLVHYLDLYHRTLSYYLYNIIPVGLGNLRYIMLAIGFCLMRRNAIIKNLIVNE